MAFKHNQMRNLAAVSLSLVGLLAQGTAAPATEPAHPHGAPTVPQALSIKPVQKDVEYDNPTADEAGKCTIKAEKSGSKSGWVVRSGAGQVLRIFVDTDGDNRVDQWSYFKDGVEVYRDIDSNHNGKADQSRWLNTAGTRWGYDKDEDRVLDAWEVISPEEVSAELVAAIRDHDKKRFERLLITGSELSNLGLSPSKLEELKKRVSAAPDAFGKYAHTQKIVAPQSTWVYFGGSRPAVVPAGTEDSTNDITVYENVAAMVDTDGKPSQVPVGGLIKIGEAWKLIDAPNDVPGWVLIPQSLARPEGRGAESDPDAPSKEAQELMAELQELDKVLEPTSEQIDRKIVILARLTELAKPADRGDWIRQTADVLNAAAQASNYPKGVERLKTLLDDLAKANADQELQAYVEFRLITAQYNQELAVPDVDYVKVQKKWLTDLETYVKKYPTSPDTADAMMQLAIGEELADDEKNAIKWYSRVVNGFAKSTSATKAEGAMRRLNSVGQPLTIKGKSVGGKDVDLAKKKGTAMLIQFWDSNIPVANVDLPAIEKLKEKYKPNFDVIGIPLDTNLNNLRVYLQNNPVSWPNIWEPGGMNSRLATELGILTVPTMLLIDQKGNVVNRNVHAVDLDVELRTMLGKPTVANRNVGANGGGRGPQGPATGN